MSHWKSDRQSVTFERQRLQPRLISKRRYDDGEIERICAQRHHLRNGGHLMQVYLYIGVRPPEPPQRPRKFPVHGAADVAQSHTAMLPVRGVARSAQSVGSSTQQSLRFKQQYGSCRSQTDRLATTFDQDRSDFLFQTADCSCQRRLRHPKPIGRAGEMQFLRNGDELTQHAQVYSGEVILFHALPVQRRDGSCQIPPFATGGGLMLSKLSRKIVQGDLADIDRLYDVVQQQHARIDVVFANAKGAMLPLGSIIKSISRSSLPTCWRWISDLAKKLAKSLRHADCHKIEASTN